MSQSDLKKHVPAQHLKNKSGQIEVCNDVVTKKCEFSEYPCHYCRKTIISQKDLEEHNPVCYTIKDFALYPCDVCGAKCTDVMDLETHSAAYHQQDLKDLKEQFKNSSPYYTEEDFNECDFCGIKFGTLGGLRNHIRSIHTEMLVHQGVDNR